MSPEEQLFWQERFDMDVAMTWISFATHIVDIESTLSDRQFAGYMVGRFASVCDDAWNLVIGPRLAQNELSTTREARLRAGVWFRTNEALVRRNFRGFVEDFGHHFQGLGGLEKIMVHCSSKSKVKPTKPPVFNPNYVA
jgi:hypothetical protein